MISKNIKKIKLKLWNNRNNVKKIIQLLKIGIIPNKIIILTNNYLLQLKNLMNKYNQNFKNININKYNRKINKKFNQIQYTVISKNKYNK